MVAGFGAVGAVAGVVAVGAGAGFEQPAAGPDSAEQVALEAGNSSQMIFKHYRELVRPAEAEKWFAIMPGQELKR